MFVYGDLSLFTMNTSCFTRRWPKQCQMAISCGNCTYCDRMECRLTIAYPCHTWSEPRQRQSSPEYTTRSTSNHRRWPRHTSTLRTGGCTAWCSGLLQQQGIVQRDAADYYNNRGLYSVMQRITTTTGGCTAWCSGLLQQQGVVQRDAADYCRGLYSVMQRITTTTGGCTAWCSGLL